jgi:adenylate cyclase
LEAVTSSQGSSSVSTDADDVIRRVPLLQFVGDRLVPSLAVEALRVAQGAATLGVRSRAGLETLRIGRVEIPVDPDGHVWIHYSERDPERMLAARAVLDPSVSSDQLRQRIAGHIVLVGTSAVGLKDLRATPLNLFEAGVVVHAELLEQTLTGWFLARPDWLIGLEIVATAVLGLLLAGLLVRAGPMIAAVASMIAALMVGAATWAAFAEARLLVDPAYPLLCLVTIYLSVSLVTHMFAERDKEAIRTAFTHYLAPAIISRLAEDPERLKLGGETKEMTFLFSDIAGFTSFTERTEPETLVRLLNRYRDGQCGIVMDHGGTVDKIVGDAVHAIFNAPVDQSDHAARAVRCALEMDALSQAFVAEQQAIALDFGRTRIGVNSGMAVIGNFGGSRRFDYTAHGDAINTAARLESVNKHLGTRICVAGSTASRCPDLAFRSIGALVLKGKENGIDAFESLTGRETGYAPSEAYRRASDRLEAGGASVQAEFAELESVFPDDPLLRLHARRIAEGELGTMIVLKEK